MIKRIMKMGLVCIMFCTFLGSLGCYGVMPLGMEQDSDDTEDKIQVICTTFPLYDWTRELVKEADNIEVSLLLDNGADMHSYQASAADIAEISSCDMLVYVGGTSDAWLEDVLRNNGNDGRVLVNLSEALSGTVRREEYAEGMQQENHTGGEFDEEYDEHIWLSVKNAILSCGAVKNGLCIADAENADLYETNCTAYTDRLSRLDAAYTDMVREAKHDTVLFADRFPFLYLMKDYDIRYYAAFPGCSSETAASFETVAFLAGRLQEERLGCVITLENAENSFAGGLARTIIQNAQTQTQIQVLSMDSMQSVTKAQIAEGMTYYSVMEHNLEVLSQAMNE